MNRDKLLEDQLSLIESTLEQIRESQRWKSAKEARPISELDSLLKKKRKQQKITQKELAALAGVHEATVRKVEHGSFSISVEHLIDVLNVLGMSIWIK